MAARATTPPPSVVVNAPPTPRLGFEDNWQPYSPRKSARLSSQGLRRAAQTPPPEPSNQISPLTSTKRVAPSAAATPTSSRKRTTKLSVPTGGRRASGSLDSIDAASAAMELGLNKSDKMDTQRSLTISHNGMLPTPAKTPKKRLTEANPSISTIARNLFPIRPDSVNQLMPSPKKGRKNYTLGSFSTEEDEPAPIQIYTDSNERIPEADLNPNNPFYGEAVAVPEPTKRLSRRRTVTIPGEGEQTLEEAEKREDGMVYVFRGKKMFRKFADDETQPAGEASDTALNAELDLTMPARLLGPLTRSSIKPRLLFPTPEQLAAKAQKSQIAQDEEAVTDIEDSKISSPIEQLNNPNSPPGAPKFGHISPPITTRATRSVKKVEKTKSARPLTPTMSTDGRSATESVSPFDGWRRTKASATGQGKKRGGDVIARGEISKRPRAGRNQPT